LDCFFAVPFSAGARNTSMQIQIYANHVMTVIVVAGNFDGGR